MTRGIFMELQLSLAHALDAHKDAVLTLCQDLVRIASENPPGNHYRECTDRLHLELDRLGLDHRVVEAPAYHDRPRYNVLGFHGAGQRTLYFHGHYDVVPAQSREQFTPPTPVPSPSKGGSTPKRIWSPRRRASLPCSIRSGNRGFSSNLTSCKKGRPAASRRTTQSRSPWRKRPKPSPARARPLRCAPVCWRRGGTPETGFRHSPTGPATWRYAHGPNEVVEIERIYQHTVIYALMAARLLG